MKQPFWHAFRCITKSNRRVFFWFGTLACSVVLFLGFHQSRQKTNPHRRNPRGLDQVNVFDGGTEYLRSKSLGRDFPASIKPDQTHQMPNATDMTIGISGKTICLDYGGFILPYPSFVSLEHADWFLAYSFTTKRENVAMKTCAIVFSRARTTDSDEKTCTSAANEGKQVQLCVDWCPGCFAVISKTVAKNSPQLALLTKPQKSGLLFMELQHLSGRLQEFETAAVPLDVVCGWQKDPKESVVHLSGTSRSYLVNGTLVYLNVPDGGTYQHFVDGVLPKIAQLSMVYNSSEFSKFYYYLDINPGYPFVSSILDYLGIHENKILKVGSVSCDYIAAEKLIFPCQAPPLSPILWRKARAALGVQPLPDKGSSIASHQLIIYAGRSRGTLNRGRTVLGEAELLRSIEKFVDEFNENKLRRANLEFRQFFHEDFPTLAKAVQFWSSAKVLIAPHGGALSNVLFLPWSEQVGNRAAVVELFPVNELTDKPPLAHHGLMYYLQSTMLGHKYWLLKCPCSSHTGIMHVPIKKLIEILKREIKPLQN